MNKKNRFSIASSLVLLAIFLSLHSVSAQIPKLFLKFVEKQNKVKSGHVKLQRIDITDNDTLILRTQDEFFISTPKDLKYLVYSKRSRRPPFTTVCKLAHTRVQTDSNTQCNITHYWYDDEIYNAADLNDLLYSTVNDISFEGLENHVFQRIPPKIDKKNIRYKILYPSQDQDHLTDISIEWEFARKTFNCIQEELVLTYFKTERMYHRIDIFEQWLYDDIHPDILDTISFKYEEIKKGYDLQTAMEQSKKDSIFKNYLCDSIIQSLTKNGAKWIENIQQDIQKDTLFFMPDWKFPLLSGDTIYSDNIKSQFLLMDMWYISCHPCRLVMAELSSIDTLYDESLLKIVSLNVMDKDTAKMSKVIKNLNLKCDVVFTYENRYDIEMLEKMGNCQGYPQLYLIDMETKQVIWHSCGYYAGFTKDITEIIEKKK